MSTSKSSAMFWHCPASKGSDPENVGWLLIRCLIRGCSWLQVVRWLGPGLEKLSGVCKELISLGNRHENPASGHARRPGACFSCYLLTSPLGTDVGVPTAALLSCLADSNSCCGQGAQLEVRAQQRSCRT